jgi:D-alanyl-D-alanine carboxypeptidase
MRVSLVIVLFAGLLPMPIGAAGTTAPKFFAKVVPIQAREQKAMTGVSWRPGCPVPLRDLRVVVADHVGFDGKVYLDSLIVHREVANDVVSVLRRLYEARFPVRRMIPVDVYGGSDFRSIEADNTSAFNCRYVEGTRRWSEHAYGRAVDINPIENPYVSGGRTSHLASRPYLDRTPCRRGMACPGNVLVRAFRSIGWGWGGDWSGGKDYQHFSASGR